MRTLVLSIAALSFVVQVAVGVPTFGTGLQLDSWNEADNEHPGEYIPDDFMMPMRDPDESVNADTQSEPPAEVPTTTPPTPVVEVTLPKPPTMAEEKKTPSPPQSDSQPKESNDVPKPEKEENLKPTDSEIERKIASINIPIRFPDVNSPNVKRVAIVIRPASSSNGDDVFRSSRLMQLLQPQNRMQVATNGDEMPKVFARIVMRIATPPPPPAAESGTCGMDDGSSQEGSAQSLPEGPLPIPIALRVRNAPAQKQPTIKGVLLKSLVPREYLVLRDIYNIMKARAAANSNEESSFNPLTSLPNLADFEGRSPFKPTVRYVALPRAPMMTPYARPMFFHPPPVMEQREPDSPEFLPPPPPHFPQEYDSEQFSPELHPAENTPVAPFGFDLPRGEGNAVDDVMKFASQMKGLLNMLLTNIPNEDSSDNREPLIPGMEPMLPERDGPEDFRPLRFGRRQMQMSFNK